MDNIRVVLASASPRREELLRQIGIIPEVIPSEIEEKVTEKEPDRVVTELSRQKAEEVAARLGETDAQTTVVVGSDTVVYANGEILGKPADEADAARMLRMLQGDSHYVYTGVTLIAGNKKEALQWKPGWTYTRCRKRKSKATLPAKSRTIRREHMEYRAGLPHISEALTVPTRM